MISFIRNARALRTPVFDYLVKNTRRAISLVDNVTALGQNSNAEEILHTIISSSLRNGKYTLSPRGHILHKGNVQSVRNSPILSKLTYPTHTKYRRSFSKISNKRSLKEIKKNKTKKDRSAEDNCVQPKKEDNKKKNKTHSTCTGKSESTNEIKKSKDDKKEVTLVKIRTVEDLKVCPKPSDVRSIMELSDVIQERRVLNDLREQHCANKIKHFQFKTNIKKGNLGPGPSVNKGAHNNSQSKRFFSGYSQNNSLKPAAISFPTRKKHYKKYNQHKISSTRNKEKLHPCLYNGDNKKTKKNTKNLKQKKSILLIKNSSYLHEHSKDTVTLFDVVKKGSNRNIKVAGVKNGDMYENAVLKNSPSYRFCEKNKKEVYPLQDRMEIYGKNQFVPKLIKFKFHPQSSDRSETLKNSINRTQDVVDELPPESTEKHSPDEAFKSVFKNRNYPKINHDMFYTMKRSKELDAFEETTAKKAETKLVESGSITRDDAASHTLKLDEKSKNTLAKTIKNLLQPVIEQECLKYNEVKTALERMEKNLEKYLSDSPQTGVKEKIAQFETQHNMIRHNFDNSLENRKEKIDPTQHAEIKEPVVAEHKIEDPTKVNIVKDPVEKKEEYIEPLIEIIKMRSKSKKDEDDEKKKKKEEEALQNQPEVTRRPDPRIHYDPCQKTLPNKEYLRKPKTAGCKEMGSKPSTGNPYSKDPPFPVGDATLTPKGKLIGKSDLAKKKTEPEKPRLPRPRPHTAPGEVTRKPDPRIDYDPCSKTLKNKDYLRRERSVGCKEMGSQPTTHDPYSKHSPFEETPNTKYKPKKEKSPKDAKGGGGTVKSVAGKEDSKAPKSSATAEPEMFLKPKAKEEKKVKQIFFVDEEMKKRSMSCGASFRPSNAGSRNNSSDAHDPFKNVLCMQKDPCEKDDPCKKEDPCKKKDPCEKEDPCKKQDLCMKEDPCKKKDPCEKEDPCKKKDPCEKEDPCKKQDLCKKEDPCKKKDPCEKEDPCKKNPCQKEDPCKKSCEENQDPCKKKEDPCKNPSSCKGNLKIMNDPSNRADCQKKSAHDPCRKKAPCQTNACGDLKKDDPCKTHASGASKKDDPCHTNASATCDTSYKPQRNENLVGSESTCKKVDACVEKDPCGKKPCADPPIFDISEPCSQGRPPTKTQSLNVKSNSCDCTKIPMAEDCPMEPCPPKKPAVKEPVCCQRGCGQFSMEPKEPPNCCKTQVGPPTPPPAARMGGEVKCTRGNQDLQKPCDEPKPCCTEKPKPKECMPIPKGSCKQKEVVFPDCIKPKKEIPKPSPSDLRYCSQRKAPKCKEPEPKKLEVPCPPTPVMFRASTKSTWAPVKIEKNGKKVQDVKKSKSTFIISDEKKKGFMDNCKDFCKSICPGPDKKGGGKKAASLHSVTTSYSNPDIPGISQKVICDSSDGNYGRGKKPKLWCPPVTEDQYENITQDPSTWVSLNDRLKNSQSQEIFIDTGNKMLASRNNKYVCVGQKSNEENKVLCGGAQKKSGNTKAGNTCDNANSKKKKDDCKNIVKQSDCGTEEDDPYACIKKIREAQNRALKSKKKEDPCKKKADPCKEKENPCKEKEDPCKEKEDPCKKKEDPCKQKEDPCKKKEDPCKKKDPCEKKDPCKKKEDPCEKKDPCKKKKDPCKKKIDPCKKEEDPCENKDPCKKKEDPCKKKEDPCKKKEDPCKKKEDEDPYTCVKKKKKDDCDKPKPKEEDDPCKKKEDPCKKKDDQHEKKEEKEEEEESWPCIKHRTPGGKKTRKSIVKNRYPWKKDPKVCAAEDIQPVQCKKLKKPQPLNKKDKYPFNTVKSVNISHPPAKKEEICDKKEDRKEICQVASVKHTPAKKEEICDRKEDLKEICQAASAKHPPAKNEEICDKKRDLEEICPVASSKHGGENEDCSTPNTKVAFVPPKTGKECWEALTKKMKSKNSGKNATRVSETRKTFKLSEKADDKKEDCVEYEEVWEEAPPKIKKGRAVGKKIEKTGSIIKQASELCGLPPPRVIPVTGKELKQQICCPGESYICDVKKIGKAEQLVCQPIQKLKPGAEQKSVDGKNADRVLKCKRLSEGGKEFFLCREIDVTPQNECPSKEPTPEQILKNSKKRKNKEKKRKQQVVKVISHKLVCIPRKSAKGDVEQFIGDLMEVQEMKLINIKKKRKKAKKAKPYPHSYDDLVKQGEEARKAGLADKVLDAKAGDAKKKTKEC